VKLSFVIFREMFDSQEPYSIRDLKAAKHHSANGHNPSHALWLKSGDIGFYSEEIKPALPALLTISHQAFSFDLVKRTHS